jgi:hypothetical protein
LTQHIPISNDSQIITRDSVSQSMIGLKLKNFSSSSKKKIFKSNKEDNSAYEKKKAESYARNVNEINDTIDKIVQKILMLLRRMHSDIDQVFHQNDFNYIS